MDRIGVQVAEQLVPVLATRFGALPDNEIEAAVLAVVDVLADADLSDQAFLAADADAEELARRLRAQFDGAERAVLAADAVPLYEVALDLACRHLVQVVRHLPTFQPAALAEILARLTTQTDHLETLLSRVSTTSLRAPVGTAHDDEFRTEYLRVLVNRLDHLDLVGLPTDETPSLPLTVAYLSLSASDENGRRRRVRRVRSPGATRALATSGIRVEDAISRGERTLVRGDAGSGKTTLLYWLAVKVARRELTGELADWNHLVPFPVLLRSFGEGELPVVEQWVGHAAPLIAEMKPDGWVRRQLDAGKAWLLVDGVDEVPTHRRRAVRDWLRELIGMFPRLRIVVTSRKAAVDKRWLDGFSSIELEPMSYADIVAFIERWHDAAAGTGHDVGPALRRMRGQLEQPHLRELAATPLLCAMLCALNLTHRSELPRNRMDLYAKALLMLLHLRDQERGIASLLDDAGKRVVLRDLAWRLTMADRIEFDRQETLEFVTAKLPGISQGVADPEVLLNHLLERSGVLREPVDGKVDFVHRTFQEYLAADEAVQWQRHEATVVGHAHLDTWHETVVMACGHATAEKATKMLADILDKAEEHPEKARALRLVATACLETAQDIRPDVRVRLDEMVRTTLVPPRSLRETDSLASVGHQILRYLPHDLGALSAPKAAATTKVAALTGSPDALPKLARYARDGRQKVQDEIENGWHFFDPEEYAKTVLADAELVDGGITVHSRDMLPHLHYLNRLTATKIRLPSSDAVSDLAFLSDVPALRELDVFVKNGSIIDLAPLAVHGDLTSLDLSKAQKFTGIQTVAELSKLTYLGLRQREPWQDVAFLRGLTGLESLCISANDHLDLSVLASMTSLEVLYLYNPNVAVFESIGRCEMVRVLDIMSAGSLRMADVVAPFPNVGLVLFDDVDVDFGGLPPGSSLQRVFMMNCGAGGIESLAAQTGLRQLDILEPRGDIDLSPLAFLNVEITLSRPGAYRGLEQLTSSVRVIYD